MSERESRREPEPEPETETDRHTQKGEESVKVQEARVDVRAVVPWATIRAEPRQRPAARRSARGGRGTPSSRRPAPGRNARSEGTRLP